MKHTISTILVLGIILTASSCKKNPADYVVEYKIVPANAYITEIDYNDPSGALTTVTNLSQFVNGIKDITLSQKPFTAKLEVKVYNTTASQIPYTIAISVDGQVKAYSQFTVAPAVNFSSEQIDFTVN